MSFRPSFTPSCKDVIVIAKSVADKYGCNFVNDVLLLIGIVKFDKLIEDSLKTEFNITLEYLESFVEKKDSVRDFTRTPLTQIAESILRRSLFEASLENVTVVYHGHILLSILRHKDSSACKLLNEKNFTYEICLDKIYLLNNIDKRSFKRRWSNLLENN